MTVGAVVVSIALGLNASMSGDSTCSDELVVASTDFSVSVGAGGLVAALMGGFPVCAKVDTADNTVKSAVASSFDFLIEQVWNNISAIGIIKNDVWANIVQNTTFRFVNFNQLARQSRVFDVQLILLSQKFF